MNMNRIISLGPEWRSVRSLKYTSRSSKVVILAIIVALIYFTKFRSYNDTYDNEFSYTLVNYTGSHQEDEKFINYAETVLLWMNSGYYLEYIDIEKNPRYNISKRIDDILKGELEGTFIEAYAGNGEDNSITDYFERELQWSGLLVEVNLDTFFSLTETYRPGSDTIHAELSTNEYVTVTDPLGEKENTTSEPYKCHWKIPLYSLMAATTRTNTDLLVLNTNGTELKILQTLPWNKIDIKVICIDSAPTVTAAKEITEYLDMKGYKLVYKDVQDIIFASKDFDNL